MVTELADACGGLAGEVRVALVEQHPDRDALAELVCRAVCVRFARLAALDRCMGAEALVASVSRAALAVVAVFVGLALDLAGPDLRRGRLRRFLLHLLIEVGEKGLELFVGEGKRIPLRRDLHGRAGLAFLTREVHTIDADGRPGVVDPWLTRRVSDPAGSLRPWLAGEFRDVLVVHALELFVHGCLIARLAAGDGGESGEEGDDRVVLQELLLRVRAAVCVPRDCGREAK